MGLNSPKARQEKQQTGYHDSLISAARNINGYMSLALLIWMLFGSMSFS
jgi:hypothetical protein